MAEVEVDALYFCHDGRVGRVGRAWDDGTVTWILEPIPAVLRGRAKAAVGTCTRKTFAALQPAPRAVPPGDRYAMGHERLGEA